MKRLSASSRDLLLQVMQKQSINISSDRIDGSIQLTDEEREQLLDALTSELVETGLRQDDEPNERGLQLEGLIGHLTHQ